ncbi:fungal-specific transcription factor domain-containing protein [Lactarius psammicola]|nr:fungal-specific transcription factor domain-containing protein [Lactarius psammicola]
MHQPGLSEPPTASRHVLPTIHRSTGPITDWSQSFSGPFIPKKRNVERACDDCRRRKTRCDGPKMPDNVCTNCVQNRKICTYVEASKPRGPPKAYVTSLEDRVEKMEVLLKRLRPEIDFSAELGPAVVRGSWKNEPLLSASTSIDGKVTSQHLHQLPPLSSLAPLVLSRKPSSTSLSAVSDDDEEALSDVDDLRDRLVQSMKRLSLFDKKPQEKASRLLDGAFRYHGRSTTYNLVSATRELRTRYLLESMGVDVASIAGELEKGNDHRNALEGGLRRQEYWHAPGWELVYEGNFVSSESFSGLLHHWPPSDLAGTLIDLYFLHCNGMFPLLHRPTFMRHFADRLYERDIWFACTCMCIFALASRYTHDPRVLLDESVEDRLDERAEQSQWQTSGFKYYFSVLEVEKEGRAILNPASLFEIQTLCLMAQFQGDTRWHRGAWYTIGVGIRKMQDIGAHSKQSYAKAGPSVANELWKRVWWYLIGLDRMQCVVLGRPCATKEDDFNAEYPLEVDDDFWENDNPQLAFVQPSDKPSTVIAFNLWLRLTDFAASTLQSLDILEHDGSSGLRVQDILNKLNGNLTEWAEKVPRHLRRSSDIEDMVLANQSATLYTTYNLITILLQRAFLPSSVTLLLSPRDAQPTPPGLAHALTAHALAVNAAKAMAQVLTIVHKRTLSNVPLLLVGAEIAAAVLCVDHWIIKARGGDHLVPSNRLRTAAAQTVKSHIQDFKSLLDALRWAAPRWETAQEKLAYLEKMLPDLDNQPTNVERQSISVMRDRPPYHLNLAKSQHSSRPDVSFLGLHLPSDTSARIVDPPVLYTHRPEDTPWLANPSRHHIPPQQMTTQAVPRISDPTSLPRIRECDPTEQPQRSLGEWTRSQRSYTTLSPLLPTTGHPHFTTGTNYSEFARVKHEPDTDSSIPPLRPSWVYETVQLPSVHRWEDSPGRAGRPTASPARDGDPGSSLLTHLYRPTRDYPSVPSHEAGGVLERDSAA